LGEPDKEVPMARKIFRPFLVLILFLCAILIVSCGHEFGPDYEADWTALEDEIEYQLNEVDLRPVEQVEVEGQEGFDQDVDG
jgi:hypothetical protein